MKKHKYKTLHIEYHDLSNDITETYPAYIIKNVEIKHMKGLPYIYITFLNKRKDVYFYERFTTMWWT